MKTAFARYVRRARALPRWYLSARWLSGPYDMAVALTTFVVFSAAMLATAFFIISALISYYVPGARPVTFIEVAYYLAAPFVAGLIVGPPAFWMCWLQMSERIVACGLVFFAMFGFEAQKFHDIGRPGFGMIVLFIGVVIAASSLLEAQRVRDSQASAVIA